jgi:hypothetical protein
MRRSRVQEVAAVDQGPAAAGMAAEDAVGVTEGLVAAEGAEADGTSRDISGDRSAGKGTTSHSDTAFSYPLPYTVGDCLGDTNPSLRFGP